jgi:ribosome-associated protein
LANLKSQKRKLTLFKAAKFSGLFIFLGYPMRQFALKGDFIALCDLLKTEGIADSGGQGKAMVADGLVEVDGIVELRKTAKIRKGQIVSCFDETIEIV